MANLWRISFIFIFVCSLFRLGFFYSIEMVTEINDIECVQDIGFQYSDLI